jgi:hypothetical protein
MACCATGTCGPCESCIALARRFPPIQPCVTDWCRLVFGHPGECRRREAKKKEQADLKESKPAPDLSAPRSAAASLAFKKRYRQGPHRGNA